MLKIKPVFAIITSSLLFSCAHSNKDLNCSDFRSGEFHSTLSPDGTSNKISRSDTIQREYNLTTGAIAFAKIKWINDCKYELRYTEELKTKQDFLAGHIKTRV